MVNCFMRVGYLICYYVNLKRSPENNAVLLANWFAMLTSSTQFHLFFEAVKTHWFLERFYFILFLGKTWVCV